MDLLQELLVQYRTIEHDIQQLSDSFCVTDYEVTPNQEEYFGSLTDINITNDAIIQKTEQMQDIATKITSAINTHYESPEFELKRTCDMRDTILGYNLYECK
jgi:hypothetical protein